MKKLLKHMNWVDYRNRVNWSEIALDIIITIVIATIVIGIYK